MHVGGTAIYIAGTTSCLRVISMFRQDEDVEKYLAISSDAGARLAAGEKNASVLDSGRIHIGKASLKAIQVEQCLPLHV